MALATYSDLSQMLQSMLVRQDSDFTGNIPNFVSLAEARINRDLRIRKMEKAGTLTTNNGNSYPLPNDYLQMRRIYVSTSPEHPIDYVTSTQFYEMYDPSLLGQPMVFTIEGDSILFAPNPQTDYTINYLYYSPFPGLQSASTNWLMANYPDIYLFASLIEADTWQQNDERVAMWEGRYGNAIKAAELADERDRHSGNALTVRSDAGLP